MRPTMNLSWMLGGVAGVLVGLGFVCPAIAALRLQGTLLPVQGLLLLLGLTITAGGVWGVIRGVQGTEAAKS